VTPRALVGERVRDREDAGDAELIVLDRRDRTAAEVTIDTTDRLTVADVNPEYDARGDVVDAVYLEEVEATLDGWRSVADLRDAAAFDAVNTYAFPAQRLEPVGGEP
jgi:hypothetical protein